MQNVYINIYNFDVYIICVIHMYVYMFLNAFFYIVMYFRFHLKI